MSLVIKNGISLNEDFLKIILRPNITDSEIAKIYKSKFKITAPHHFLNLLASEEYKRILGNTEIEATDISEMKLAKLIDQHFEDLDEGIEF